MVRAFDGDSTMTSLVPRPSPVTAAPRLAPLTARTPPPRPALAGALVAFAVVAAFVLVVSVLAGTLFPSSHRVVTALRYPVVTRRPIAATIGPVRCVPTGSPDYTVEFTTAG